MKEISGPKFNEIIQKISQMAKQIGKSKEVISEMINPNSLEKNQELNALVFSSSGLDVVPTVPIENTKTK